MCITARKNFSLYLNIILPEVISAVVRREVESWFTLLCITAEKTLRHSENSAGVSILNFMTRNSPQTQISNSNSEMPEL